MFHERAVVDDVAVPKARSGEPFFCLVNPKPYFARLIELKIDEI